MFSQISYAVLLSIGIHHRETIFRKQLNFERVLDVEIDKTQALISKLVPLHMVSVILNEKKQVDEFDDMTILFTDMVGFTAFSNNKDPREVVSLLSKLFSRFDQLCEEFKVYKVHTIGDCYVIMGYTGRVEKAKRTKQIAADEAHRVLQVGLEMIDIIKEIREQSNDPSLRGVDMRIGIHTGKMVAGIIGSKVVRYDIFGEGVLVANKMESNGVQSKVCISEDTKNLLKIQSEAYAKYDFEEHESVELPSINKRINSYLISAKQSESIDSELLSESLELKDEEFSVGQISPN